MQWKTIEEQITEHIKLSFMRLMPYMLLMEKHIKDTKMLWRISTRIMKKHLYFQEKWDEKLDKQKRFGMQVTMMIFILQVKKNQKNPYSVKKLDRDFFIPPFLVEKEWN